MNPEKHLAKNNQSPEKLSDDIEIKKAKLQVLRERMNEFRKEFDSGNHQEMDTEQLESDLVEYEKIKNELIEIKEAKLNVLRERILEKQELYQNNKYKDIDIEQLESDLVEYEKIKNELMGNIDSISPEQALEIMGEDLYIGPSDIEKTFNFTPENIPNIPFSKERLENARELGQQLVLYVDSLDEKTPLTSKQLKSILPEKTQKNNPLFYNNWYETDSEMQNITPRLGWRLTTPEIIPGSNDNKNYLEQTEHLITYLTDTVYKDSEIPEIYQTAIDEFNKINTPDFKEQVESSDEKIWKLAAKKLSELSINQLTRENYTEIIYRLALNEKKSGTQNLENTYSWSNNVDSGGELVRVGGFDSEGLHVLRWRPGHRGSVLGVCFSAGE